MRSSFTKTERVEFLLTDHPDMHPKEIALLVGCSLPHVYRVRKAFDWEKAVSENLQEAEETAAVDGGSYFADVSLGDKYEAEQTKKWRLQVVVAVLGILSLFAIIAFL